MTAKMLMVENTISGNRTNYSVMAENDYKLFMTNQLKIQERLNALFENVTASDHFVFNDTLTSKQAVDKPYVLPTISTGLVAVANQHSDFAHYGSDFVDLNIIKTAYKELGNNITLSVESSDLLRRYDLTADQLNSYEADDLLDSIKSNQRNISVDYVTQKTNTFMLHALSYNRPEDNSPLAGAIYNKQKIEVLRSANPEICASSIQCGEKHLSNDFSYSRIGAIISSGNITHASATDFGSTVGYDGKRNMRHTFDNNQENIEAVVKERTNDTTYNEVLIDNPDIAGVYFNLDSHRDHVDPDFSISRTTSPIELLKTFKRLHDMAKDDEQSLPIFTIYNGEIRETAVSKSFINQYLPDLPDVFNMDIDEASYAVQNDYENKLEKWRTLSNSDFIKSAFFMEEALEHHDLLRMGINNRLSDSHKIELIEKNAHVLKGDIVDIQLNKLKANSIDNNNLNMDLDMDLSVLNHKQTLQNTRPKEHAKFTI